MSAPDGDRTSDSPIRVICADDHVDLLQLLARVIDREPDLACVHCASDAQGVIDYLEQCAAVAGAPMSPSIHGSASPVVVLLDLTMPGLDPLEAARHIMLHWPATRVVACSGHDSPEAVEAARCAGACGHVGKHLGPTAILAAIRQAAATAGRRG